MVDIDNSPWVFVSFRKSYLLNNVAKGNGGVVRVLDSFHARLLFLDNIILGNRAHQASESLLFSIVCPGPCTASVTLLCEYFLLLPTVAMLVVSLSAALLRFRVWFCSGVMLDSIGPLSATDIASSCFPLHDGYGYVCYPVVVAKC